MKRTVGSLASMALVLLVAASAATAQKTETLRLPMRSGTAVLEKGVFDTGGDGYLILRFERKLGTQTLADLRKSGIRPLSYLQRGAWLCAVGPSALTDAVRKRFGIVAATPWQAGFKASPGLRQGKVAERARAEAGRIKLLVTLFEDIPAKEAGSLLSKYDPDARLHFKPNVWAVQIEQGLLERLLAERGVQGVEEGPRPFEPLNDQSRALIRVDEVQDVDLTQTPPYYRGLSGSGVNVAVSEGVYTYHQDFWQHDSSGNVTISRFLNPGWPTFHGTHVAGIIGGNGWTSSREGNGGKNHQWRGMAPEASLVSGDGYDSYPVHASNHSYVMDYGDYGFTAAWVDRDVRGANGPARRRPHVWAVANQGGRAQYDDEEGYYSIYAPAKNAIGVGAMVAPGNTLAGFSSLGPTFDGRIKPDVMAAGCASTLPLGFDWTQPMAVEIDYIRVLDGANQIVRRWEFNRDGDLQGWFATDRWGITNERVQGGLLRFDAILSAYGSVDGVNLRAQRNHKLRVRYRVVPVAEPFETRGFFWWAVRGGDYVDGKIEYDATVDAGFHVVTMPVGRMGRELDGPPGFGPIDLGGWTGTIQKLRIDPVAGPRGIVSTWDVQNAYIDTCGTSMAAPAVTGTVALLLQQFAQSGKWVRDQWEWVNLDDNAPLPSTIKAVLVQTAEDLVHAAADPMQGNNPDTGAPVLYHEGPDYATGYGLVDARAAADLIAAAAAGPLFQERSIENGRHVYDIDVAAGLPEIKATLAWDDVEGNTGLDERLPRLVNDLDLVLIDPDGVSHYPWTLDPLPVADCGGAGPGCGDLDPIRPEDVRPAYRAPDHRNNVEVVQVPWPTPGRWRVVVAGEGVQDVTDGPQDYSLVSTLPLAFRGTELDAIYEGFDYPPGTALHLVGAAAAGWGTPWLNVRSWQWHPVVVEPGSLSVEGLDSAANHAVVGNTTAHLYRGLAVRQGGSAGREVWLSFVLVDDDPGDRGSWSAFAPMRSGQDFGGRLFDLRLQVDRGAPVFRICKDYRDASWVSPNWDHCGAGRVPWSPGPHLVVLRITLGADASNVAAWVDPPDLEDLGTPPLTMSGNRNGPVSFDGILWYVEPFHRERSVRFDEIRIGPTRASVLP